MHSTRVLFLHGLEGSPEGTKAKHLLHNYVATIPMLATRPLQRIKKACNDDWATANQADIDIALYGPYEQAKEALRNDKFDVIVGSSMGGAILTKLSQDGVWDGPVVYCAPAHKLLLGGATGTNENDHDPRAPKTGTAVWIHGIHDDIVDIDDSVDACRKANGHVFIVDDDHRLASITETGVLDTAIAMATNRCISWTSSQLTVDDCRTFAGRVAKQNPVR